MELDKIISGDSAVVLQSFPPDCIDLTVTSPPYDNLRTYNGFTFDFETIAKELFRVTKAGGVVVWVVGDATIKGSETGTSFRQALYFMQCGFNLHDTMIYKKNSLAYPTFDKYYPCFEYMFVFSKGKPVSINLIADRANKQAGKKITGNERGVNGSLKEMSGSKNKRSIKETGIRFNIWEYNTGWQHSYTEEFLRGHPAIFPEALAQDHILSWSNEGDIVLDCFSGSGTTPKMAKLLNRHYIGIDTSAEYVAIANERLAQVERGLTQRAPDLWDSAPLQSLSTPEADTPAGHLSTPPTSG